jgi:type 1 glutamine amidotransferase
MKVHTATCVLVGLALSASRAQQTRRAARTYEVDGNVVAEFRAIVGDLKPGATPAKPRRLLIYAISHGPHRFGIPTAKVILTMLGEATGSYTAVVSEDLANFEPDALKQFDAVCFANTTGEVFYRTVERDAFNALPAEEREKQVANAERLVKNLTDYVRNGGGFFGIHAATDTLKKSPAYGEMIGGCFDGHPWAASQTVYVQVERPDHPLCKGVFPVEGFSIQDEIYQMKSPYERCKVQVLLSLDLSRSEKPKKAIKRNATDLPISWVKPYGKGRVFYSVLGHNKATFHNPLVLQHWLNGLQYVMGD